MKILIPTYLDREKIEPQVAEIRAVTPDAEIFASCLKASASVNRNACLDQIEVGETSVMIDDDIRGFYRGWIDDLFKGLEIPGSALVSARLLNKDGALGPTCSCCYETSPEEIVLTWKRPHCIMPTAAIAFVHRGHRFDESFSGSGFEDNDWMKQYAAADPTAKFIQSNRCRLIHLNEMKNQKGPYWEHNKRYFSEKWFGRQEA